ncbi:putative P-loop containing nucleoside triphosphate hydrolase [Helianthus anomalus]
MVFQGNECPQWSIKPGMQIAENCRGLPFAVVVIAGVLAKEARSEEFGVEIAHRTSSYIIGDHNGCMEILGLSYNNLPLHLRECFLYLGTFPEYYKFQARWLIWSWVAEGFIQQDGNRSLKDIAEGYLMDLIDRNLVIVRDRNKYGGGVKAFKVHDLIRELCLEKAKEERFILETEKLPRFSNDITPSYKSSRSMCSIIIITSIHISLIRPPKTFELYCVFGTLNARVMSLHTVYVPLYHLGC